jgi:hypothetical protein
VKVRIRRTPREAELDGVPLHQLRPGNVREVSPVLATWLVAERYADVEMRADARAHEDDFPDIQEGRRPIPAGDVPHRRSGER